MTIPLPEPTDDLRVLARVALWGLRRVFRYGYRYKKVGVVLMDLNQGVVVQGLFDTGVQKRNSAAVMEALDKLNGQYGRDTVRLGSAGGAGRWHAKFQNVTPHYTTDWDQLPTVK